MAKKHSAIYGKVPNTGIEIGVMADFQDMFDFRLTNPEILDKFCYSQIGEQLFSISRLITLFYLDEKSSSRKIFNELVKQNNNLNEPSFFVKKLKEQIDKGRILNSPHILLNVAKHVLFFADNKTWAKGRPITEPNVHWLSIYFASILSSFIAGPQNDTEFLIETVQNATFYKRINTVLTIQRSAECYINISKQKERFISKEFIDIHELFKKVAGIDISTFIVFMTGIILSFTPTGSISDYLWSGKSAKNLIPFVNCLNISSQDPLNLLKELSLSVDEFKLTQSASINNRWDFLYFRQKPLVHIGDLFFPINIRFVLEYIWDGIYWRIIDGVTPKEAHKFRTFFGRIFETYCQDLLSSISSKIKGKIIPEFKYGHDNSFSPDAFIDYGDDLIVIDFKAKRLKMRDTLIDGNVQSFIEDINQMMITPAEKVYSHLKKLSLLKSTESLLCFSKIKRIHPIIVTQGSLIGINRVYKEIDDQLYSRGLYSQLPITHWHLLDITEFEYLIGLLSKGVNLPNTLLQKSSAKYKYLSFYDYLSYANRPVHITETIRKRAEKLTDNVIEQLKICNYFN